MLALDSMTMDYQLGTRQVSPVSAGARGQPGALGTDGLGESAPHLRKTAAI